MKLESLLNQSDVGKPERELKSEIGKRIFNHLLSPNFPEIWLPFLYEFSKKSPWSYFDLDKIEKMISFLEVDTERSAHAVKAWEHELSIVFNDFFSNSKVAESNYSLDSKSPKDNVIITNDVHPEYLWLCEHIFGNLVCVFWGINRKKNSPVKAKFDLGNGERDLKSSQKDDFYLGFNDRIRNGVAHGEVHFRGDGIVYGKKDVSHEYKLDASELLDHLDELRRTTNNLALALILFLGRNKNELEKKNLFFLPDGLANLIFISFASREGFKILGLIDSKFSLAGSQLQIYIKSMHRKKNILIYECLRIAQSLNLFSLKPYDRYFYEIDTSDSVTSSIIVDVNKFKQCLKDDNMSAVPAAIDTSLLWTDESKWLARFKTTSYIFKHHFKKGINKFNNDKGANTPPFMLRYSEVISTDVDHRLKLKIVINQQYSIDQIHEICTRIINKYKYRPLFKKGDRIFKKQSSLRVPSYIWITAYYKDGPLRWIGKRGWTSGNIAFSAEWISKKTDEPIYIKDHEFIKNNIRYQFRINEKAYKDALKSIEELAKEIKSKSKAAGNTV